MTAREIFEACIGTDDNGENRAAVKVQTSIMHRSDMTEEPKEEMIMDGPEVDIFQSDRLTIINLRFDDQYDTDLLSLTKLINDFQTFENTTDGEDSPIMSLAVMPKDLDGYYVMGVGGVAVTQASKPGEVADTASFIFTNDTVAAYLLDTSEVYEEEGAEGYGDQG